MVLKCEIDFFRVNKTDIQANAHTAAYLALIANQI